MRLPITLFALMALAGPALAQTTYPVGLGATINGAAKKAQPGDTILLNTPGKYPFSSLYGSTYSRAPPGVTIACVAGVLWDGLGLQEVNGYTVKGCTFIVGAKNLSLIKVKQVVVENNFFSQKPGATPDEIRPMTKTGISMTDGGDIIIRNNEFAYMGYGLSHRRTDGLQVIDNEFHDMALDGIRGTSSNVLVQGNFCTDFYRPGDAHNDCIQFWTDTSAPKRLTGIIVRDNMAIRGNGGSTTTLQMGDEADRYQGADWTQVKYGYDNPQIIGNFGGMGGNCLSLEGFIGGVVRDNLCIGTTADTHYVTDENGEQVVATIWPDINYTHSNGGLIEFNVGPGTVTPYKPVVPPQIGYNMIDSDLFGKAGDYTDGFVWWAGRREQRHGESKAIPTSKRQLKPYDPVPDPIQRRRVWSLDAD